MNSVSPISLLSGYEPFILHGWVEFSSEDDATHISILRDTRAAQLLILSNVLKLALKTYTGTDFF